jgi:hypothetical protein
LVIVSCILYLLPSIGGDHFTMPALRANVETPLGTKALTPPTGDAVFRVLDDGFMGVFIYPQHIHRAAGHTRSAPRTLIRVKVIDHHFTYLLLFLFFS